MLDSKAKTTEMPVQDLNYNLYPNSPWSCRAMARLCIALPPIAIKWMFIDCF